MAIKHFSRGVVRGSILAVNKRETKTNKKEYLDLKVSCPSSLYGPVETRVRMYGKVIKELLDHYKNRSEEKTCPAGLALMKKELGIEDTFTKSKTH